MKVSVCMSTYNRRPEMLRQVFDSIFCQDPIFEFEVIVVDDGSELSSIQKICQKYPVKYHRIERPSVRRNPCVARNTAYKLAKGEFVVIQSDEVVHKTKNSLTRLVAEATAHPDSFIIANVLGCNPEGEPWSEYTGPKRKVPYFFLGVLRRHHLYAVGGNDEEFENFLGYEDQWFADCLTNGLHLSPVYITSVIGYHLYHLRSDTDQNSVDAKKFYLEKHKKAEVTGIWLSSGGPWEESRQDFDDVFEENRWKDSESKSGPGSSLFSTKAIRKAIPSILDVLKISSILDIPCGDYNWMNYLDKRGASYLGADISSKVVKHNQNNYSDPRFTKLDIRSDSLPACDLVICRDCLGHLSFKDCFSALDNIKCSKSKYILMTTFWNHINKDLRTSHNWAPRSMCQYPFKFPVPLLTIDEQCQEHPGFTDKSLALWRVTEL